MYNQPSDGVKVVKSGLPPPVPLASHVPLNCNPVGIAAQVPSPFKYVEVVPPSGT